MRPNKSVLASALLTAYLAGSAVTGSADAGAGGEAPDGDGSALVAVSTDRDPFRSFGSRWRTVPSALGDALAEGSAPRATTRDWTRCVVRYGQKRTVVVCPDGWTTRWRHEYR